MNILESCTIDSPFSQKEECAMFTIDDTLYPFTFHNIAEVNSQYTLSMWVKANIESKILFASNTIPVTTSWVKQTITFAAKSTDLNMMFHLEGTYYVYHIKLERGDKATDWSPSPYDVEEELEALTTTVTSQGTQLTIIQGQISSKIWQEDITTAIDSSETKFNTKYSEFDQRLDSITTTVSQHTSDINSLTTRVSNNETKFIQTDDSIASLVSRTEIVENKFDDYSTTSEMNSAIDQKADSILLSVDESIINSTDEIRLELIDQNSSIETTCNEIISSVLESYVKMDEYGIYKESVESNFEQLSNSVEIRFTSTEETLTSLNNDTQAKFTQMYKYFTFTDNGLTISAGNNAMSLILDNDKISFQKNGTQFGWWDGVDFHTGNIIIDIEERAQFGKFAFVPRSDGSLSFLKVG